MKKAALIILSLALFLSFSEATFADSGTVNGTIVSVDLTTRTITLSLGKDRTGMDQVFKFDNGTNFVEGDALKSFKDLKPGDSVTIIYKSAGNTMYAKTVTIKK